MTYTVCHVQRHCRTGEEPVTASLNKITAGDGYTYLTQQVAAHDMTDLRSSLADYYTERGEAPGRWMGTGLDGLARPDIPTTPGVGDAVTEAHMKALFGAGRHPEADRIEAAALARGLKAEEALQQSQLGKVFVQDDATEFQKRLAVAYREWNLSRGQKSRAAIPEPFRAGIRTDLIRETFVEAHGREPISRQELDGHAKQQMRGSRKSCAGFDMTFSPVKSVSALWAIAPREVSEVIEAAQTEAVGEAIRWLETEMSYTRRGYQGARQTEVTGLMAGAFVHRDTRAGDPDLHTHVAISNKVQAKEDGAWLALDGGHIYRATVAASERYNSALETALVRDLGVSFVERDSDSGRRTVREIAGLDTALLAAWSQRRTAITTRQTELAAQFEAAHLRPPTPLEALALAQQATLETREGKHEPRSLAEQRQVWRSQAIEVLGSAEIVDEMAQHALSTAEAREPVTDALVASLVASVTATVEADRATFQLQHVLAEAERKVRAVGVAADQYRSLTDSVTAQVLAAAAPIGASTDGVEVPESLRRSTGESVYVKAHSQLYTTARVVRAEQFIARAAAATGGGTVKDSHVDVALLESMANGVELNPSQAHLVREFATSGSRVALALAPAGSGKTTAMAVLARAWRAGGGTIVGASPTHVASHGLQDAMGCDGGPIASLTWALENEERLPEWAASIDATTLVVVDEAGMAGTMQLATLVAFAMDRGASVRLLGDDQQLAAVQAGGVLRDIVSSETDVLTLTELMRFHDPAEAQATLAVRDGDTNALGFYADHDRIHTVADDTATTAVFEAWRDDTTAGMSSLMLADTRARVAELNALARQHRVAAGEVTNATIALASDGNRVGVGDRIVTRTNDRRLRLTRSDWVKNRDHWHVETVFSDGSLLARGERHGRQIRLPQDYVVKSVELGYASTVHCAQGMTVDTSHVLVSGTESRQTLYVALSRGRRQNHAWVATSAPEHSDVWEDTVQPPTPTEVLEQILGHDGRVVSAATALDATTDMGALLSQRARTYQDGIYAGLTALVPQGTANTIRNHVTQQFPAIQDERGWPVLEAQLLTLALLGQDATAAFDAAVASRPMGEVRNVAAIISYRLDDTRHAKGQLPSLDPVPAPLAHHDVWGPYLKARSQQVQESVDRVRETAQGWVTAPETCPGWAVPRLADASLLEELAVWRAVMEVPEADSTATGPPAQFGAQRRWQDTLTQRVATAARPGSRRWMVPDAVRNDPYWEVLERRLNAHLRAGNPVTPALVDALNAGPLPVEYPAAALWYRVQGRLVERTPTGRHVPHWGAALENLLPAGILHAATAAPGWNRLVDALDVATGRGHDPVAVVTTAAALINTDTVEPAAVAPLIAQRVNDLLNPPEDGVVVDELHDPEKSTPAAQLTQQRPPHPAVREHSVADTADAVAFPLTPEEVVDLGVTDTARIIELNRQAAAFYRTSYPGSSAASYIAARFGSDLSKQPGLVIGCAPGGGPDQLTRHLCAAGATAEELIDAGLSKHGRHGVIDVFRDRVVFGIHNPDGDLVGFVGRAAPNSGPRTPKYLNTPATRAFSKGAVLFGLHENQGALHQGADLVRVEGPMDAIAVTLACDGHAVGVAPLGTALTVAQAQLLASHTDHVWEATDNDAAGRAATARDQDRYNDVGILARQLILLSPTPDQPYPKDPAELFTQPGGAEQLRAAVALGEGAPTTAARLLSDTVNDAAPELSRHNANTIVAVARQAGQIIAPLPPSMWEEHIQLTADLITDHQPGSNDADVAHARELVANETESAGQAWQPPTVKDPFDNGRGRHTTTRPTEPEQRDINHDALSRARAMLEQLQHRPAHKEQSQAPPAPPAPPSRAPERDL